MFVLKSMGKFIYSKSTIATAEKVWIVFKVSKVFIFNLGHISYIFLVFLSLILSTYF